MNVLVIPFSGIGKVMHKRLVPICVTEGQTVLSLYTPNGARYSDETYFIDEHLQLSYYNLTHNMELKQKQLIL